MMNAAPSTVGSLRFGPVLRAGIIAALGAALVNVLVYGVARLAGVDFAFAMTGAGAPPAQLPVTMVLMMSITPAILASLALAGGALIVREPVRVFQWVAGALAVLSLGMPVSSSARLSLELLLRVMHLVAGAFIVAIPLLAKRK